jgi:NAD(P)-dependent dehydrogenase (short-subunit alcohol dehydrogenase family)
MGDPSDNPGVAIITGGAKGIGLATLELVLERGGRAVALDKDSTALEELRKSHSSDNVLALDCDVTEEDDIAGVVDQTIRRFGRIDALVNNAGIGSYFDAITMTQAEWDLVFSVDLKSVWLASKLVLPHMMSQRSGSIINVASIHARMTIEGMFPYAAAKSGVIGLTRSLALDMAKHQIRVNAVSPGWTRTWLVQEWFEKQPDATTAEASVVGVHPLGRICEPREVAEVVCFLASTRSSAVTGAEFSVDAGLSARFAT